MHIPFLSPYLFKSIGRFCTRAAILSTAHALLGWMHCTNFWPKEPGPKWEALLRVSCDPWRPTERSLDSNPLSNRLSAIVVPTMRSVNECATLVSKEDSYDHSCQKATKDVKQDLEGMGTDRRPEITCGSTAPEDLPDVDDQARSDPRLPPWRDGKYQRHIFVEEGMPEGANALNATQKC